MKTTIYYDLSIESKDLDGEGNTYMSRIGDYPTLSEAMKVGKYFQEKQGGSVRIIKVRSTKEPYMPTETEDLETHDLLSDNTWFMTTI